MVSSSSPITLFVVFAFTVVLFCLVTPARSGDVETLLSLKSSIDPSDSISWRGTDLCNWEGDFPESLTSLHRLKTIFLGGNRLSGRIPSSLLRLSRLYTLNIQDNLFTGSIPPLNQASLGYFNVSNNNLSGQIPPTRALKKFDESSFTRNVALCGDQIQSPCEISPAPSVKPTPIPKSKSNKAKLIGIIAGSVAGGVMILMGERRRSSGNFGFPV